MISPHISLGNAVELSALEDAHIQFGRYQFSDVESLKIVHTHNIKLCTNKSISHKTHDRYKMNVVQIQPQKGLVAVVYGSNYDRENPFQPDEIQTREIITAQHSFHVFSRIHAYFTDGHFREFLHFPRIAMTYN